MKQSVFIAALKFASHAAAVKDIRYYLNGVLFEFTDGRLYMVGTDGHRLAYAELDATADEVVDTQAIVSGASVKLLLTAFKQASTGHMGFTFEGDKLIVQGASQAIHCELIEGKYPDWRRVSMHKAERDRVPTARVGVNADYLAAAAKACGAFGASKYDGVKMDFYGENECMILQPDTLLDGITSAAVVVMPMRL